MSAENTIVKDNKCNEVQDKYMKPYLCFLGGCEFEYIIHELKSDTQKYYEFDYFHSYEHRAETNPYTFLSEHAHDVFEKQHDMTLVAAAGY